MTTTYRLLLVCTALILLGACSNNTTGLHKTPDDAYLVTIHVRSGDTFVIGADKSGRFKLTLLNEGAGNVIVTCDKADYESPVTLGPRGTTTRRIASDGSATLTVATGQEAATVAITTTSNNKRAIPVNFIPGPESLKLMSKTQTNLAYEYPDT